MFDGVLNTSLERAQNSVLVENLFNTSGKLTEAGYVFEKQVTELFLHSFNGGY